MNSRTNCGFARRRLKGVTLIELLISMVIGLVVIGAVLVSMVGSGKGARFQTAYTQMNEDAQIGLSILSRDIQMAGFSNPTGFFDANSSVTPVVTPSWVLSYASMPGTFVFGCDTGFATPTVAVLVCAPAPVAPAIASAAIEAVYEADGRNVAVNSTGLPTDCIGTGIGATPPIARNRFFVAPNATSGRPELQCANSFGQSESIVENIENMQILYGLSLTPPAAPAIPPPPQVVRYVPAALIAAAAPPQWGNVLSVRVCLLVRSADPVLDVGEDSVAFTDCNGAIQTSADRHLRRAYFMTAAIRSQMP